MGKVSSAKANTDFNYKCSINGIRCTNFSCRSVSASSIATIQDFSKQNAIETLFPHLKPTIHSKIPTL